MYSEAFQNRNIHSIGQFECRIAEVPLLVSTVASTSYKTFSYKMIANKAHAIGSDVVIETDYAISM